MATWKETTEDRYFDQLGAVPPLRSKERCFMVGEALSFDNKLGFVYTTMAELDGRFFETILPEQAFHPGKFFEEIKTQFQFQKETTGKLIDQGLKNYGLEKIQFFQCVDCDSNYPVIDDKINCNGAVIELCPWCRSDSKPWTNGRGA